MKKILFLILITSITLVVFGCGKKALDEKSRQKKYDVYIYPLTNIEDYNDATLEKMKSLGKSITNKRLVIAEGSSINTTYHIFTFEDGKCITNEYYYFYVSTVENFDSLTKDYDETNKIELWGKSISTPREGTWEELKKSYSYVEEYKILE